MQRLFKSVFTALFIFSIFALGAYRISSWMTDCSYRALLSEIQQACAHCYAMEGRYPPDLSYLEEHYGIRTSNRQFIVEYRRTAPDRSPEIRITTRQGGAWA